MTLRFVIDAQLPPMLVRWFAAQGYQASHVFELDLNDASDRAIWRHAQSVGAVIVSKDADFAQLSIIDPSGPPVIWIRLGNMTTAVLIQALEQVVPILVAGLESGERLIEVR